MAKKENKCWPGFEPVPGKPEYSKGSCKKVSSAPGTKTKAAAHKKSTAKRTVKAKA